MTEIVAGFIVALIKNSDACFQADIILFFRFSIAQLWLVVIFTCFSFIKIKWLFSLPPGKCKIINRRCLYISMDWCVFVDV